MAGVVQRNGVDFVYPIFMGSRSHLAFLLFLVVGTGCAIALLGALVRQPFTPFIVFNPATGWPRKITNRHGFFHKQNHSAN